MIRPLSEDIVTQLPTSPASEDRNFDLAAYQYDLPPERIAQNPVVPRDSSRLMVVKAQPDPEHHVFRDLSQLLQPGDLLVQNNTRVFPARLYGAKASGAQVEVLLIEPQDEHHWLALVKPGRRLQPGTEILFKSSTESAIAPNTSPVVLKAKIVDRDEATGGRILQFSVESDHSLDEALDQLGQVPLPPYITDSQATPEQYQTVYAQASGSVAAPTAGLHFTPALLKELEAKGVKLAQITLHVGIGTFRPVSVANIRDHQMHAEWIEIPQATVDLIHHTQVQGGRVIAIGTTATRALEGAAQSGVLQPYRGKVNLFIYPGYRWRVVQGLITNFHLPGSSLMMLVSAMVGRERLLSLYETAIAQEYRFYSFGDAMFITPEVMIANFGK